MAFFSGLVPAPSNPQFQMGFNIHGMDRDPSMMPNPNMYAPTDPRTHTQSPIVTGTSVLGIKYDGGVLMVADMLGSYGSMARFKSMERLRKIGDYTVVGAGGDMSDFQYIIENLDELVEEDEVHDDKSRLDPNSIHKYLSRMMYNRRSKMDPLWNSVVVGGFHKGKSFLGLSDLTGLQFEDDIIATGYGGHLAMPLMRNALDEFGSGMSYEQAKACLDNCMRVLFYRDCRAINKLQFANITADGIDITPADEAVSLDTVWNLKAMVRGGH
jgi:20S proteasome subunit beta 7